MHLRGNARLVPLRESPYFRSFPVATGRTVSELSGNYYNGTSLPNTQLRTPQATRGESRSITSPYCQLVYLNHFRSLLLEDFSVWWYLLNHYGRTTRLLFRGG